MEEAFTHRATGVLNAAPTTFPFSPCESFGKHSQINFSICILSPLRFCIRILQHSQAHALASRQLAAIRGTERPRSGRNIIIITANRDGQIAQSSKVAIGGVKGYSDRLSWMFV